jgi:hypothetical protein
LLIAKRNGNAALSICEHIELFEHGRAVGQDLERNRVALFGDEQARVVQLLLSRFEGESLMAAGLGVARMSRKQFGH